MPLLRRRSTITSALAWLVVTAAGCGAPLGSELFLPVRAPRAAEAIVVLGNRPARRPDGDIAPELERRIRRAVELYRAGLAPRLVLTGSGGEAEAMAEYALARGVPPEALAQEPRARDTAENARFAVGLLCEGRPACHPEVLVVSSPYHLRRAVRLFECAGARARPAPTEVPADRGYQASFTAYEYGVRLAYVFDDACARASSR